MALSFNGTTDAVKARTLTNLIQPCTLALWVFPTAASSATDQLIIANGNPASNGNNIDKGNTGAVASGNWFYTQSGVGFFDGGVNLALNKWSHLAVTDNASTAIMYTNGSQTNSVGAGGFSGPSGANFTIGGNTHSMPGNVADVAAWTVILTPAEIYALGHGTRPNRIRPGSLRGWWSLDGYGLALDRSGYNNFGTITGTALVPGPPLISAAPILVSTRSSLKTPTATASTVFRRTLSPLGTRAGSRQSVSF